MAIKYSTVPIFEKEADGNIPLRLKIENNKIILTKGLHVAVVDEDEHLLTNILVASRELTARTEPIIAM
jgi:hypothetical protein